eukprot:3150801-Amphidinium_carterae.1
MLAHYAQQPVALREWMETVHAQLRAHLVLRLPVPPPPCRGVLATSTTATAAAAHPSRPS